MHRFTRWFATWTTTLVVACGGGGGETQSSGSGLLVGDSASLAVAAAANVPALPAPEADIVNGLILSRLDIVIAADATVAQVNAALDRVGATSISAARAGSLAMTIAVPRQASADALAALATTLEAQPGILAALPGPQALTTLAPPSPADADVDFLYLQRARFPAAWNARAAAGNCINNKVTVIVADMFVRPPDVLYAQFPDQLPGVTELGSGSAQTNPLLPKSHGHDVVTTLAAKLDATVPTGANPFPDCLEIKALQLAGLNPYGITAAIEDALAATSGKVVVNASFGWDACGTADANGVLPPCTIANLSAPKARARAIWAAIQRQSLAPFGDRTLVASSGGNEADTPVGTTYAGAGIASFGSAFNVAAIADSTMSFASTSALWEPTVPCPAPPCLPSLTATAAEMTNIATVLANLGQSSTVRAENVAIVGSVDNLLLQRSTFSEPGAPLLAVGEGIPTLLGAPQKGTSFSSPQVAALASYLWLLSPELRARPAKDTVAAIKANASSGLVIDGVNIADGMINAYATVLSLDEPVAVTPASAKIRLALLDVAGQTDAGGNAIGDGRFDLTDLQAFRAAYLDGNGAAVEPSTRNYGRLDLNGDGFTGGGRTTRMDLDPRGSTRFGAPQLSTLNGQIAGKTVTYNELAVTDALVLCFYATTGLYTGSDLAARDAILEDLCVGALGDVETQSFARLELSVKARNDNCSTPQLPECDIFRHSSEPPSTTGSAQAEEPLRTITATSAAGSATASGSSVSSITSTAGAGGVLTVSGSASTSANARYQAPFAAAEANANSTANSNGTVVLTRPHTYVLQVTITKSGFTVFGSVSLFGSVNQTFEGTTSVTGVLPAGRQQVSVGTQTAGIARLEKTADEASANASFTLTLTPQ